MTRERPSESLFNQGVDFAPSTSQALCLPRGVKFSDSAFTLNADRPAFRRHAISHKVTR